MAELNAKGVAAARTAVQRFTSDADRWAIGEAAIEAYLGVVAADRDEVLREAEHVAWTNETPVPDRLPSDKRDCFVEGSAAAGERIAEAIRSLMSRPLTADRSSSMGDGWIEWNGGACPVGPLDKVQVRFRDRSGPDIAAMTGMDDMSWEHIGEAGDIVAYRIVVPPALVDHTGGVKETSEAGKTAETLATESK